jgi:exoribonuclease-2
MYETAGIGQTASETDVSIRDLRTVPWLSIDNDDSRDLDQLSVAEGLAGGAVRMLVAIADVDGLVQKGSAIDSHARHNTTSVYTPAVVFPMLPVKLSTDLTSLGQDQDRLAVVVEMVVGTDGSIGASAVYRAIVRNRAKLAYNGVAAWLGGGPVPGPVAGVPGLDEQLRIQDRVAHLLKGGRHRHGALSLETIEPRAVFDGDVLADLRPAEKNRAKELIEELMVAANGVTARYLAGRHFPSVRRVLRSPKRWDRIVELAGQTHHQVVKLLGSGEYQVERPGENAPGHFGLAVQDYAHSTAPNRRYPDVVTQRLLKAAIAGRAVPYGNEELEALARHCTEQEDNATKVP